GCAISGLFDLEPMRLSYHNEALRLDEETARRNSPIYHLPRSGGSMIVAVGGLETEEFLWHSAEYANTLKNIGYPCEHMVLPNDNHFTIIQGFGKTSNPLTQDVFRQMSLIKKK
ncbi:MAG: hypothetical protein L0Y56_16485, partial [Nitrospira sp.]|nr:hypothetical protein [Nitrospira sp.]